MSEKKELEVSAIENGTVIDHIPAGVTFKVVQVLDLYDYQGAITIGNNLDSKTLGKKGIIKVADKFFSDEELNQLSVITPNVTLCIIRDYEVVEKKTVRMPELLTGIVKCPNPKCITNNEPMKTRLHVLDKEQGILQCHYCNKEVKVENVKLV